MTLDEAIKHAEEVANDMELCCKECAEEHRQLAEWLKELKQLREQTDGDLISRQSVITMLNKIECAVEDGDGFQFNEWVEYAKDIPSAEKTAEWIKQKSGDELFPEEIVCSKCYHSNSHLDFDEHNNPIGKVFLESKYCPNCGAKMEESGEEE